MAPLAEITTALITMALRRMVTWPCFDRQEACGRAGEIGFARPDIWSGGQVFKADVSSLVHFVPEVQNAIAPRPGSMPLPPAPMSRAGTATLEMRRRWMALQLHEPVINDCMNIC